MNKSSNFDLKIYKRLQSFNKSKVKRNNKDKMNLTCYKDDRLEFKLPEGFKKEDGTLDFSYDEINISFKLEEEEFFKRYTKDQLADPMNKHLKDYTIGEDGKIEIVTYRTISEVMNTFNFVFFKNISGYNVFGIFTSPNRSSDKWIHIFEEIVSSIKAVD